MLVVLTKRSSFPTDAERLLLSVGVTQVGILLRRPRLEQVVGESEARFQTLIDCAPVMVWMSGTDKRFEYFNKPWLDFTGRALEHELGDGWADGVHPEDRGRCLATYANAFVFAVKTRSFQKP